MEIISEIEFNMRVLSNEEQVHFERMAESSEGFLLRPPQMTSQSSLRFMTPPKRDISKMTVLTARRLEA